MLRTAGAREIDRSGARQADRRAAPLCRRPAPRQRRRQPDPRRRTRLRQSDQVARRIRDARQRARLRLLRCLDAGETRERLRHHAAVPGADRSTSAANTPTSSPPTEHVADPLIDDYDEGMTTASVRKLFAELKHELMPMVRAITEQPPVDDRCLRGAFDETAQLDFGLSLGEADRLRPRSRPARRDASSVLHQILDRRRADHDPRLRQRHRPCAVLDLARGRPCALRAGRQRRARRHAARQRAHRPACTKASRGCGKTWSAAAAASGSTYYPLLQKAFPRPVRTGAARDLLSRHQQGRTAR